MVREVYRYAESIGKYCLTVLQFLGSPMGMGALSLLSAVYNPYMLIITVPIGIYLYVDGGLTGE